MAIYRSMTLIFNQFILVFQRTEFTMLFIFLALLLPLSLFFSLNLFKMFFWNILVFDIGLIFCVRFVFHLLQSAAVGCFYFKIQFASCLKYFHKIF